MKYLGFLLLFIIPLFTQAQVIPDFEYTDGRYYHTGASRPYSGVIYQYHESGEKKAEIILLNGKIHGQYVEWYKNGKLKSKKEYDHGLRDGLFITYFKDGKSPQLKGYYVQGIPLGHWSHFNKKGDLVKLEEYDKSGEMIITKLF